jgi:REP element-mobilizing transposase RayT
MAEPAVRLTSEQRAVVERTIRRHCKIRGWRLHALNVRSTHVHVVVSADRRPNVVMVQLKAWCSRKLSDFADLKGKVAARAGRRRWSTEGGDVEIITDECYVHNAVEYVLERQ